MSNIPEHPAEGGAVVVVVEVALREYLTKLEATEAEKPLGKRRPVPSIQDLATVAGVTRQTLYNMANHRVKMVSLEILSVLLTEFRRRGFPATVSDLLVMFPAESEEG